MAEEEEDVSRKLVVCNCCKTDYIVQVNGLLRPRHRSRIGVTPFRWCVEMVKPLDINEMLLKHTLSWWVPEHEKFNSVVCRVIRPMTNMSFRLLNNLDNLNQYNWSSWVSGCFVGSYEGDVIFLRILSWSSLMIRTHGIKSAFEYNKVVLDWELSEEEKNITVVHDALDIGEDRE
ncbi:hypothetical protein DEO72_LG5g823 [Vigna unguiculata]|uniref:Uncharacterized protein n=1 Tax=Vigna unguiculata TaxID=3917 RepID=A0A4D6LXZ3_VIGUN|nr:hypothetical protein DEO72_LG5g823 [Vigna unguiculata]